MVRGGGRARKRVQGGVVAVLLLALALVWSEAVVAQEAPAAPSEASGVLSEPLQALAEGDAAEPRGGLRSDGPDNPQAGGPASLLEQADGVLVQVFSDDVDGALLGGLTDAGARIVAVDDALGIVTVSAAPAELAPIATVAGVRYVREVLEPLTSIGDAPVGASGLATVQPPCGAAHSEGDTQLDAIGLRQDWDVEGLGVEVGILSDTWNRAGNVDATNLADDIASGDIPGASNPCPGPGRTSPVPVLAEYFGPGPIDEGRAMGQIVHDLAPAADLSFASAFNGDTAFANSIRNLREQGADVIVDDIFYFNEPAFQNGPIGVAVEEVVADGAAYFSAIGNETETINGRRVSSYETPGFRATACPAGITGTCHDFDPGAGADSTFRVGVADLGLLRMSLKWNEPWNGVTTNLDLFYVVDGEVVAQATENNPTATKQPFEMISMEAVDGPVTVDVVVRKASGATNPRFKLDHIRSALTSSEYQLSNGGDVMGPNANGHAAAPNGVGVGAVPYNYSNAPEGFSNHGPATWYWGPVVGSSPAAALGAPQVLQKPDVAATDGGRTTFFFDQTPPFTAPRFFGTSAAAPHAAAIAALLLDCNPSLTPAQITAVLKVTANPVAGGVPTNVGAGLIDGRNAGAQVCLPPGTGPAFAVSDASVVEGNGGLGGAKTLSFTVSLSEAQPGTTSVLWATSAGGTATAGTDYTAKAPTKVTFSAGQTSKVVKVTVKGDKLDEPDETVRVQLSSPVGVPIADAIGVGTILDDDPTPVVPLLTVDDVSVLEGTKTLLGPNTTITFTVHLSAPAPAGASFKYQTANGDAVAPSDYAAKGLTTVNVPIGATSRTVTITLRSDAVPEPDEFFFLLLSNPVGLTLTGGDGAAAGFIRNDD